MKLHTRLKLSYHLLALVLVTSSLRAESPPETKRKRSAQDPMTMGLQPDGRILVPTNQMLHPAGRQVLFPGRPVDLALSEDGKTLLVKNMGNIVFIDVKTAKIRATLPLGAKELPNQNEVKSISGGLSVTGLLATSDKILVTNATSALLIAEKQRDGSFRWAEPVTIPKPGVGGAAHPAGLCLVANGRLWVTSTRGNCVHLVNLQTGAVEASVPTGIAPFAVCAPLAAKIYVSNWGGDPPQADALQASTSGTMARIDPRTSVVNDGTVSVLTLSGDTWSRTKSIPVGLHPSGMVFSHSGKFVYVANANSDTVSVIRTDTDTVVETIACRPDSRLPFGSGSNALALSPDGATLYVANGTNNCLLVVALGKEAQEDASPNAPPTSTVRGLIPTGWYPGAIIVSPDHKKLFVANVKGHGLLAHLRAKEKGKGSGDFLGSVSILDVPDDKQLAAYTAEVNANNRLALSITGLEPPRAGVGPVPVPERHGEPSVIKHVLYVIKENKTYDQVFGDIREGEGDKKLCIFPENITPNAHALAREFTLFDNFYCSGSKSPDGHSWVNEAYVTDYLERTFGGFTRSYPYEGSDPLAFAATGFLWDNALAHAKTFRNYGEYCKTTYTPKGATWLDVYRDYQNNTRNVSLLVEPNLQSLQPYSHPAWPGFPLRTPDVYRARLFKEELATFEQKGEFPNLLYVYLPQDHTAGTTPGNPTPRAMVADNDLALGEIVEAVSKSSFWRETCIFVVEDDPQSGYDHVDGHRTVALVISPYTRRKYVDHSNYNQTGMVKTIELILGLPPMTQLDLCATAMRKCFRPRADLTPYAVRPAQVPLDEMNKPLDKLKGASLDWAKKSMAMSFEKADEADDDTLNRVIWYAMRGSQPYPKAFGTKDDDDD